VSPQKMTGLYWKSDAVVTVIRPLLKGTGDPPERHRRGKISKKPGSNFRFGFFFYMSRHPQRSAAKSTDPVLLSQRTATGFFDFARNDNVINAPTNLKIHAHH